MSTNVNLKLLQRLVEELQKSLDLAEAIKLTGEESNIEYTVEMGKALGLASSISQEGIYLAGDIARVAAKTSQKSSKVDPLWDLFSPKKKIKTES